MFRKSLRPSGRSSNRISCPAPLDSGSALHFASNSVLRISSRPFPIVRPELGAGTGVINIAGEIRGLAGLIPGWCSRTVMSRGVRGLPLAPRRVAADPPGPPPISLIPGAMEGAGSVASSPWYTLPPLLRSWRKPRSGRLWTGPPVFPGLRSGRHFPWPLPFIGQPLSRIFPVARFARERSLVVVHPGTRGERRRPTIAAVARPMRSAGRSLESRAGRVTVSSL